MASHQISILVSEAEDADNAPTSITSRSTISCRFSAQPDSPGGLRRSDALENHLPPVYQQPQEHLSSTFLTSQAPDSSPLPLKSEISLQATKRTRTSEQLYKYVQNMASSANLASMKPNAFNAKRRKVTPISPGTQLRNIRLSNLMQASSSPDRAAKSNSVSKPAPEPEPEPEVEPDARSAFLQRLHFHPPVVPTDNPDLELLDRMYGVNPWDTHSHRDAKIADGYESDDDAFALNLARRLPYVQVASGRLNDVLEDTKEDEFGNWSLSAQYRPQRRYEDDQVSTHDEDGDESVREGVRLESRLLLEASEP
ncbi:hypothetical protein PVAG01_01886 [Phlyctema vagabunda]|uniref:Uncharacterized protein n=1 Tax=Phlyctema vagabunda TaxID=108571 RepID=A0ABR4PZ03_9HELO